ncbi:hypothetical protein, partial [uncultured Alcanivorax sp.]|uniref:hypothetical protein n=1 Tax=uncultured Alcanivorax sp. TaxID=191215 RepID=UPI00261FE0A6
QQVSGLHVVLRSDLLKQNHRNDLGGTNAGFSGAKKPGGKHHRAESIHAFFSFLTTLRQSWT